MNSVVTFRLVYRQCSINTVGLTSLLAPRGRVPLGGDFLSSQEEISISDPWISLQPWSLPSVSFRSPSQAPGIETQPPGQPMPTPEGSL